MAGLADILGGAAAAASFLNTFGSHPVTNTTKFYSQLHGKKGNLARTNRFLVMLGMPRTARGYASTEFLTFMCDSVTLPGIAFQTNDVKAQGYGPSEKRPHGVQFGDITLTFLADAEGEVQKYFFKWMNSIVRFDAKPGQMSAGSITGMQPYETEYRSEYIVPITITTYSESDDRLLIYRLNEAWPVSVGDTPMNWGDTDQIVRVPVQFSFLNWEIENVNANSIFAPGSSNQLSLLQTLVKTGTAIQTLATLRKPQSVGDAINVVNNSKLVLNNVSF